MAAVGEIQWPHLGRNRWPLTSRNARTRELSPSLVRLARSIHAAEASQAFAAVATKGHSSEHERLGLSLIGRVSKLGRLVVSELND